MGNFVHKRVLAMALVSGASVLMSTKDSFLALATVAAIVAIAMSNLE